MNGDKMNRTLNILREWYIIVVLIAVWGAFGAIAPGFLSINNITSIIVFSIPLLAVSLGQNVVILTGGFDLSLGAQVSLMTGVLSVLMTWSVAGSLAVALLVGCIIGLVNGFGVSKLGINPFLMTLGMMFVVQGLALFVRPSPGGYISDTFADILTYSIGRIPVVPLAVFGVITVSGMFILRKRQFGRLIYAIGDAEEECMLRGIDVEGTKLKAYLFSGIMAAIGGIYMAAWARTGDPSIGGPLLFESITAVVLGGTSVAGGTGKFINTVFAALVLGSASSFLFFQGVNDYYRFIINGLILIIVVGIQQYTELGR